MSARAPSAIYSLWYAIHNAIPAAELSGIVGDAAHSFGYHLARRELPGGDYSVQLPRDRQGPADAASALDVKLSPALMRTVTYRLFAAARANDPRLRALREFCGTLNGQVTAAYDLHSDAASYGQWDDSHLWHVHLSFFRAYADDKAALLPIAQVMAGKAALPPPRTSTPSGAHPRPVSNVPKWPLPAGHYFGPITGPKESHGGYVLSERPHIKLIQRRLQILGHAPKAPAWVDGVYGHPTVDAVTKWQRAKYRTQTTRFGEVWKDDWTRLFTK